MRVQHQLLEYVQLQHVELLRHDVLQLQQHEQLRLTRTTARVTGGS